MAARRILVTGGAGFVGTRLCHAIAARPGFQFRALDLPGPRLDGLRALGGDTVGGDLLREGTLEEAAAGCEAVIHLVVAHEQSTRDLHERLTLGGVRRVTAAMAGAGVDRLLFMSSIKAARDYAGLYGEYKRRAEEVVKGSGLRWTIFRPGLLYGPGEIRLCRIAAFLRRWPVFPMPGGGRYPIFPVRTEDLASALLAAVERPETAGRTYELGTDAAVTLAEIVSLIEERIGVRRMRVPLPLGLCRAAAAALEAVSRHPILFAEQVKAMQAEVAPPDTGPAKADLGFSTPPFPAGLDALVATWDPALRGA